jgi:rhodanese-related sulfurtransferase
MAYSEKFQKLGDAARARVVGVDAKDVDDLVAGGAVLLDIRDKEEFDAGTMPGALHLSRGKLEMNVEAMLPDLSTTILCFCNANHRGALSADALRAMGYDNARVITGGLNAWRAHTENGTAGPPST